MKTKHPIASNVALFAGVAFVFVGLAGLVGTAYGLTMAVVCGVAFLWLCWAIGSGKVAVRWPFTL